MSTKTERETLLERAELLGLDFKKNISTENLRNLVNNKVTGEDSEPEEEEEEEVVEVKSKKAEPKAKKVKTDAEIKGEAITKLRKEMTKLRRVIVSCNDPDMQDYETTPIMHVSNSLVNLPKMAIPLNVEWHIPQAYYDELKTQTCGIKVKSKTGAAQVMTTVRKEIKRYSIQDLPDLTGKELEELRQAQLMRDGVAKV